MLVFTFQDSSGLGGIEQEGVKMDLIVLIVRERSLTEGSHLCLYALAIAHIITGSYLSSLGEYQGL